MRYRVGDRYLSEKEYAVEKDQTWFGGLFILGAVAGGLFMLLWSTHHDAWPKWIRFVLVCVSAIGVGSVFASLRRYIQTLIGLAIITVILGVIGYVVWLLL